MVINQEVWRLATLGSFLRGNVLQLGKVHPLLLPGRQTLAFIAIDPSKNRSTAAKARSAFGYTKIQGKSLLVRGLNVPLAAPDAAGS